MQRLNTIIMKKVISLIIGCSLSLAGAALAQQPVEQQSPSKGKRAPEKTHTTEPQPRANPAKPQERPNQTGATRQHSAANEHGGTNASATEKTRKAHPGQEPANAETNASEHATGTEANQPGAGKNRMGRAHDESAKTHDESANTVKGNEKQETEQQRKTENEPPAPANTSSNNPAAVGANAAAAGAGQQNMQARRTGAAKKPAPQQVQQVKTQHANFRAQPKPQQVPPVTFNQNYRIQGSDRWQGQQYQVFRSYQPQWHDQGWYRSHYSRVELIGGGYYFFNNGYWFPAWGYSPSAQYYAYDGPIYVGQRGEPPDRVIADTQALLQEMGYYTGEVDGLLGPLTRQALAAYQADNGLATTEAIDQPTLDSLGLA
jgi:Putative peptidoglycan binding domain